MAKKRAAIRKKVNKKKNAFAKKHSQKPFRDIEKDGITYSFLDEWLMDREQARLSYVEGWSSKGLSVPLDFGLSFHDCLEWVAKGRSYKTAYRRVLNPYYERKAPKIEYHERGKLLQIIDMADVVFKEYWKYWQNFDKDFRYLFQEESFNVPHRTKNGHEVPLRGRWDAVYQSSDNGIWLMENKTKSVIDELGLLAALPFDLQSMLYVHALQTHLKKPVAGILYNVIRRPQLRQKKTENHEEFIQRVQDDVVKRPEHYFMRWKVDLTQDDIDKWVTRSLDPILDQVYLWWQSIKENPFEPWESSLHYANPTALFTRYGRSRYFDMITRGSTDGLYQRTNPSHKENDNGTNEKSK